MDLTEALKSDGWKRQRLVPSVWTEGAGTMVAGQALPGAHLVFRCDQHHLVQYRPSSQRTGWPPPKTWDEFVARHPEDLLENAGETPIIEGNNELWPFGNWASHIAAKVVPPEEYVAAFSAGRASSTTPGFDKALQLHPVQLHDIGAFNKDMQGTGRRSGDGDFHRGVRR